MHAFSLRRLAVVLIGLGALAVQSTWAQEPPSTASLGDAAEVPADPVERRAAEFTERTRRMMLGDADRIREASARRAARSDEISALSVQLSAALALPPASLERQEQIDQTAQSLQNLIDRILDDRAQAKAAHAEAQQALESARTETEQGGMSQDSRLKSSRVAFLQAHEDRTASMLTEIDGASENLGRGHCACCVLEASPPCAMRRRARRSRRADIHPSGHRFRRRRARAHGIGLRRGSIVQALGGLFLGLMQLALLLVLGMWVHGRLPGWTTQLLTGPETTDDNSQWTQQRDFPRWMVPGDWSAISDPLGRALQDLVVGGIGVGIILWLGVDVPLLAWISLIFVCGAAVRLGQGVVELTLVTPDESRPALRVVDASVRAGLMWTVRSSDCSGGSDLLSALLGGILGADAVVLFTKPYSSWRWVRS